MNLIGNTMKLIVSFRPFNRYPTPGRSYQNRCLPLALQNYVSDDVHTIKNLLNYAYVLEYTFAAFAAAAADVGTGTFDS